MSLQRLYHYLFLRPYFTVRTWWPMWYGILNRSARCDFAHARPTLSPLQARIVADLERDGVSVTTLEELFPDTPLLDELRGWEQAHPPKEETAGKKKYLREYWDLISPMDFDNPFFALSLRDEMVDVVESYMGMWVRLKQYHLGKTLPNEDGTFVQSQLWHRDPEEKRLCKVFIYLNDVPVEAGPFTYLPKSTYGKRFGHLFPQRPPEGCYPPVGAVERAAGGFVQQLEGPAGTVIFCDPSGLHFGGRAVTRERLMFTVAYTSPRYSEGARLQRGDVARLAALPKKQRFLLEGALLG